MPDTRPQLDAFDRGLLQAVVHGEARLTPEQSLRLLTDMPLPELGFWADQRCRAVHGDAIRTYVIDRNINYTNVCTAKCTFCAFRRDEGDADAYVLPVERILQKIQELVDIGGTQILMQGGMHPGLPLGWYEDLLRAIKSRFPQVHVHAFSPPEFVEFVRFFDPPGDTLPEKLAFVLRRLRDAGLDSVPGGGGEIFAPAVRRKIGLGKCTGDEWLSVMREAHRLGMNTSATMMFGHIEGYADRIHHMEQVRSWQDRAVADFARDGGGRCMAFISWSFQRENTPLGRARNWGEGPGDRLQDPFPGDVVARLDGDGSKESHPEFGRRVRMSGSTDYLRTQAVSRLHLDNVWSIGSSWVTMGPLVGQAGLRHGANDMGSVMMEENVVSSAGTTHCLNEAEICRLIRDAGFLPAQRDNRYDLLRVHDGAASPDLRVRNWAEHRPRKLHAESPREKPTSVTLTVGSVEAEPR